MVGYGYLFSCAALEKLFGTAAEISSVHLAEVQGAFILRLMVERRPWLAVLARQLFTYSAMSFTQTALFQCLLRVPLRVHLMALSPPDVLFARLLSSGAPVGVQERAARML